MLGMLNKGGGQNMPQGMGQNPNLAALFGNNQAAAPAGAQSQLPQIMAPQTPNIGMPPRPAPPPVQQGGNFPATGPLFQNGRFVSPGMARAMMMAGGNITPQITALAHQSGYRGGSR